MNPNKFIRVLPRLIAIHWRRLVRSTATPAPHICARAIKEADETSTDERTFWSTLFQHRFVHHTLYSRIEHVRQIEQFRPTAPSRQNGAVPAGLEYQDTSDSRGATFAHLAWSLSRSEAGREVLLAYLAKLDWGARTALQDASILQESSHRLALPLALPTLHPTQTQLRDVSRTVLDRWWKVVAQELSSPKLAAPLGSAPQDTAHGSHSLFALKQNVWGVPGLTQSPKARFAAH